MRIRKNRNSDKIVKITEKQPDPLQLIVIKKQYNPPVSLEKKVPIYAPPSIPLSKEQKEYWKLPPCISMWKNPKSRIISLEKRMQHIPKHPSLNINFEKFSRFKEALDEAENDLKKKYKN
ncbi:SKIP/SNW domain-containing protein [Hamiltosporidium tvaerminnensis]|uniref:Pre-mRNA-processing protein 45 n=1 Tax=Hamiltosporidium tvaerminnensis TaxID=1176355 RepID=A0A4Q9M2D3_9MICR|nr:SKIP/SNW domain-containing protein [Hamiltosporidium tvaerminnensis]